MNAPSIDRHLRLLLACFSVATSAFIASCGGAIGSGGTGAAPPGVSGGTVTGFGSVIIDGLRFDDRAVPTVAEIEPANHVLAEARLGHRVEVESDAQGEAKALRIDATVTGGVTAVGVTGAQAGSFVVLGQTVTLNADAIAGPVTQFGGGYSSALDIRAGDVVEVHGAGKPAGATHIVQATRIEKLPVLPTILRVAGIVTALGQGAANRFALGGLVVDYGAAPIMPAGGKLANGVAVLVFAPAANLATSASGELTLTAGEVRIKTAGSAGAETYASGFVTLLDTALQQFNLNGIAVLYRGAELKPGGMPLADGQYVQARGSFAADGSLVATQVKRRDGKSEPEAELKGTIVGFNAANNTFQIRDVLVSLGAAKLGGCPGTGLRDGLFVELHGTLTPNGVLAKEIECKDEPAGAVVERKGVASAVDLVASSFTLTAAGKPAIKVGWNALTFFRDVTPLTLSGKTVEVEGALVNGDMQATKIKISK